MSETQPPMQLNKQVGFMILITLAALFVPILGVGWFARDIVESRRAAAAAAETPSPELDRTLRESLERTAHDVFPATEFSLVDASSATTVQVPADAIADRVAFLETEVARAGGTSVTIQSDAGAVRLLVTAPVSNLSLIRRSLEGVSQPYLNAAGSESDLLEIRIEPLAQ